MQTMDYLPFDINGQRFALELCHVHRVLPFISYQLLPDAPAPILGIVNLNGKVVPIADLRIRLGWPPLAAGAWTPVIWATGAQSDCLLPVDNVWPVTRLSMAQWSPIDTLPVTGMFLSGVMSTADGLLLIHHLDALLSVQEWEQLHDRLAVAYD